VQQSPSPKPHGHISAKEWQPLACEGLQARPSSAAAGSPRSRTLGPRRIHMRWRRMCGRSFRGWGRREGSGRSC